MKSSANKRELWDQTNHYYKKWMNRGVIIELFERTVDDVDGASNQPLEEKRQTFMDLYRQRVEALVPETAEGRVSLFAERAAERLALFQPGGAAPRPARKSVTFSPEAAAPDLEELRQIRRSLAEVLNRLDAYLKP